MAPLATSRASWPRRQPFPAVKAIFNPLLSRCHGCMHGDACYGAGGRMVPEWLLQWQLLALQKERHIGPNVAEEGTICRRTVLDLQAEEEVLHPMYQPW
mmetsp:Transcript_129101/g.251388  ORF Transcript_129101/g.251388 Transcript_129101/m.251388 type:complete len:99 (+) Transcript_129101:57-353(+)